MMKQKAKRPHWLSRLMTTWLPTLIAPIVLAIIVSGHVDGMLQDNAVAQSQQLLGQIIQRLESQFADVESYAISLTANTTLRGYVSRLTGQEDTGVSDVRKLIQAFPDWNTAYGLIDTCCVYLNGKDTLVSGKTAYTRLDKTYDSIFRYGDMSYSDFKEEILTKKSHLRLLPLTDCLAGGRDGQRLLLTESIVNYATGRLEGQILIYLSADALARIMDDALSLGAVYVSVTNSDGDFLTAAGREDFHDGEALLRMEAADNQRFTLHGQELLATTASSPNENRRYRLFLSIDSIAAQIASLKQTILLYLFLLLGVALVAFAYSAVKFRQPYQQTFKRLVPSREGRGIVPLIEVERAVDGLISSREEMEKKLDAQKAAMTSSLYYLLINGGIKAERQLEQMLGQVDGKLSAPHYFAVLIEVSGAEQAMEDGRAMVLLGEALERMREQIAFSVTMDSKCYAALYPCAEGQGVNEAVAFFKGLYESLLLHGNTVIQVYLGMRVDTLRECPRSFDTARHLRDCAARSPAHYIVTYDRQVNTLAAYDYSQEDAYYLSTCVAAGDFAAVKKHLDDLSARNSSGRLLGSLQTRLLLFRMTDTLNQAAKALPGGDEEIHWDELLQKIIDSPFTQAFDLLRQGYELLCAQYAKRKKSHNVALAHRIIAYLEENYPDENLCLTSVSLHFGLNERYLSSFFKEQTGCAFTGYVQQLRIKRANELLAQGNVPIAQIARQVGYTNPNTFRNAYKRCMGRTPSNSQKKQEDAP